MRENIIRMPDKQKSTPEDRSKSPHRIEMQKVPSYRPVDADLIDVYDKIGLTNGDLRAVGAKRQALHVKIAAFRAQVRLGRKLFFLLHQVAVEQGDLV